MPRVWYCVDYRLTGIQWSSSINRLTTERNLTLRPTDHMIDHVSSHVIVNRDHRGPFISSITLSNERVVVQRGNRWGLSKLCTSASPYVMMTSELEQCQPDHRQPLTPPAFLSSCLNIYSANWILASMNFLAFVHCTPLPSQTGSI